MTMLRIPFRDGAAKPAALAALAMLALAAAFAMAAGLDARRLPDGDNVWLKPIRFALSFAIHLATLTAIAVLTRRAAAGDRWFAGSVLLQIAAIAVEILCIATQAARGVPSHFYHETLFDRAVFTIMGIGTGGLVLGFAAVAIGLARHPGPRVPGIAVSIGAAFALAGAAIGVVMVLPTAEQAALLERGLRPFWIGAHSVGLPSGEKLPFFGWDMAAGDWRPAHFIGLHGLQTVPLIAWIAARNGHEGGLGPVLVAAAAHAAVFAWAVARTMEARSILAPDLADILVLAACALAFAAAAALAAWSGRAGPARLSAAKP
jgi:hypothetical protein